MEPSTLAPRPKKPSAWWILATIVAGAAGSLAAIAAGGRGTYDIAPFKVELRAWPAFAGKTELAVRQVADLVPSHAEAGTHRAPIVFRATIVSASTLTPEDAIAVATPHGFASKLAEDGKDAARSFGLKLGLLALGGAAAGGAAVSLGRMRRIVGAIVAGVVTFGVIGLLVQQTYDKDEFLKTQYVVDSPSSSPAR